MSCDFSVEPRTVSERRRSVSSKTAKTTTVTVRYYACCCCGGGDVDENGRNGATRVRELTESGGTCSFTSRPVWRLPGRRAGGGGTLAPTSFIPPRGDVGGGRFATVARPPTRTGKSFPFFLFFPVPSNPSAPADIGFATRHLPSRRGRYPIARPQQTAARTHARARLPPFAAHDSREPGVCRPVTLFHL